MAGLVRLGLSGCRCSAAATALEFADVGVFNIENSYESAPLKTVSKHAWTVLLRIVQEVQVEVQGRMLGYVGR